MPELMTIGYEGLSTAQFFETLQSGGVQTVLDVRQLPLSRKPGFSKNALAEACSQHDIGYRHLSPFGCPQPIRNQYKQDGCWECYTTRFLAYLETQILALEDLAKQVDESRCCLLCFEADPMRCHRSLVATRVAGISQVHITVKHLAMSRV